MKTSDVTIPTDKEITEPRIKDASAARKTYELLNSANKKRRATMAQTRNQLEGGRPMDPAQLKADGEEWRTNVNFRDAETAFNRTYLPYWKMVHDVPNKIASTVNGNTPKAGDIGKAIDECFDLFLEDWGSDYFFNFMGATQDFVKFGPAYVTCAGDDSPRFEHARSENVLLPKRAKANIGKWEIVCIETEMSASDLWKEIKDEKTQAEGKYVGWNPDAVRKAIMWLRNRGASNNPKASNFTEIQDMIASNDIAVSEEWGQLPAVKMLVKNFDGTIACYIFARDGGGSSDFIFKNENFESSMEHAINGLFYDVGTGGLVHTIKGFAIKNYYFSLLQNRVKSRLMDAVGFATAINLQEEGDTPDEAPPVQNHGAVNVFPRGLKQMTVYPQLGQAMQVLEVLQQNSAETNYIYNDATKQIADTQTARQATILANIADQVGSATVSIYLAQIGNIYAECFRRLIKKGSSDPDAKRFIRRLKQRNVTQDTIDLIQSTDEEKQITVTIRTGANPGTAGAAIRDQIFKELLGMINIPGMNVTAIRNAYLANKLGSQAVSQYTLPEGVDSFPAQRREAMIENSLFGQGMPLPVDPSDAHFEHCDEHLKPIEAVIQSYQQKGQLQTEHLIAIQFSMPHMQQHLAILKGDETSVAKYKQVWARFSQVSSIVRGILAKLQQERKRAQQQQAQQQGGQPIAGGAQQLQAPQPVAAQGQDVSADNLQFT